MASVTIPAHTVLMNKDKKIIVSKTVFAYGYSKDGYIVVGINDNSAKYGVLDADLNWVIPPVYDYLIHSVEITDTRIVWD